MQAAFSEPAKNDPNCEIRLGIASWDDGSNTAKSMKYTWFDKNGKAARGGEIPVDALPQALDFAIRSGYLRLSYEQTDYEAKSSLVDTNDQVLANVVARFSPKDGYGSFRLDESEDPKRILTKTTSLRTADGRRFAISNLRQCPCEHLMDPQKPHLEFDYRP